MNLCHSLICVLCLEESSLDSGVGFLAPRNFPTAFQIQEVDCKFCLGFFAFGLEVWLQVCPSSNLRQSVREERPPSSNTRTHTLTHVHVQNKRKNPIVSTFLCLEFF